MLVMFGVGVAVLWWMAALTALMIYEKSGRFGAALVRPVGAVLLVAAALQLAHPSWLPAALGGSKAFASELSVGPGAAAQTVRAGAYELQLRLDPNRATQAGFLSVRLRRGGARVDGARVRATFTMLDMAMPDRAVTLSPAGAGAYRGRVPVLGMSGRWGVRLDVAPPHAVPVAAQIVDRLTP
jgi:hypothetical protein